MKNKWLIKLLVCLLAISILATLVACDEPVEPHTHTYAEIWEYDQTNHWHNATCDVELACATAQSELSAHTLQNGECSVCGYVVENLTLEEKYPHITIAEAIELATQSGEVETSQTYTIVGTIVTVSNATYGEMTVQDETGSLYIYGSMSADGTYYSDMTDRPVKGDKVVLTGVLKTYKGTPQMSVKDKKAIIVEWEKAKVDINPDEYVASTILQARNAEKGAKVQVTGVVAKITYANGHKPCGFILIDNTSSIYVYDGDVAAQVSEGDKIVIAASKTYWILQDEQSNAALYRYNGACQLEEVTIVDKATGNHEFSKSWITESTVKSIVNTPFDQNITSLVYKVTALVQKAEGNGFVNYYIDDLDGKTGSYVYTQCNGSDFGWLDEFDGKICTVYLTALNAKSTATGCLYRLLPVAVEVDQDFAMTDSQKQEFALEYCVDPIFEQNNYQANPALQLPKSYDNAIINANGVTFEYSIDNTTVAEIVDGQEFATLNLLEKGSVKVTVKAHYNGTHSQRTWNITYAPAVEVTAPTIAEILAMEDGTATTIRGVVMSSLVNKQGFYIGDDTGMIAVLTTKDLVQSVKPGDEVAIDGCKVYSKKNYTDSSYVGQCLFVASAKITKDDNGNITAVDYEAVSELVANYYGEHSYDDSYFVTDKTIDDLTKVSRADDLSTTVYVVDAIIVIEGNNYYTNVILKDTQTSANLLLYSSSGAGDRNQYNWLFDYEGKTITLEVTLCDWNSKGYKGCVISAIVDGERIVNQLNFAN